MITVNLFSLSAEKQYQFVQEVERRIKLEIPKFEIIEKEKSWLMKALSILLFFCKNFMTQYITTIYPKIYFPKDQTVINTKNTPWEIFFYLDILCHEFQHLKDRKKYWIFFNLIYLFPQILVVGVLLAMFLSPWFLLFLLCLAPIPAIGRAWIEFRGYSVSLGVFYWLSGDVVDIDFILNKFTGPDYYWMWPFRNQLKKRFETVINQLKEEKLSFLMKEIQKMLLDSFATISHT